MRNDKTTEIRTYGAVEKGSPDFLYDAGASEAAAICSLEVFDLLEHDLRLVLHDPELADAVSDVDLGITHGQRGKTPDVVVSAIRTVYDTHVVRLDHTEVLIR